MRRVRFSLASIMAALTMMLGALVQAAPAQARTHYGVIWQADFISVYDIGWHRHSNEIGFELAHLFMPRARNVRAKAHCVYGTSWAGYGGIDGNPGWTTRVESSRVVVTAPSRLADAIATAWWLWPYAQSWAYYCEVWWDGP